MRKIYETHKDMGYTVPCCHYAPEKTGIIIKRLQRRRFTDKCIIYGQ